MILISRNFDGGQVRIFPSLILKFSNSEVFDSEVFDSVIFDSEVFDSEVFVSEIFHSEVFDPVVFDSEALNSVFFDFKIIFKMEGRFVQIPGGSEGMWIFA